MNFGFTFGDETIAEAYFYVTAYPLPDTLPELQLPVGVKWLSDGFSGAILRYDDLVSNADPTDFLIRFWSLLLSVGRQGMLDGAVD